MITCDLIQVWKKSDWSCVKTFPCHSDSVWDLKLHNTTVVTDMKDNKTWELTLCLSGHSRARWNCDNL